MDNMNDTQIMLLVLALYVAVNGLLWILGAAIFLVAARFRKSLNDRSERYWKDRQ